MSNEKKTRSWLELTRIFVPPGTAVTMALHGCAAGSRNKETDQIGLDPLTHSRAHSLTHSLTHSLRQWHTTRNGVECTMCHMSTRTHVRPAHFQVGSSCKVRKDLLPPSSSAVVTTASRRHLVEFLLLRLFGHVASGCRGTGKFVSCVPLAKLQSFSTTCSSNGMKVDNIEQLGFFGDGAGLTAFTWSRGSSLRGRDCRSLLRLFSVGPVCLETPLWLSSVSCLSWCCCHAACGQPATFLRGRRDLGGTP